jgi:hypothetical protein
MTDEITISSHSLTDFIDRPGLSVSARDRVIAIDRELARQLDNEKLDADGCADLVLESVDLTADFDHPGLDFDGFDRGNVTAETVIAVT